MIPFVSVFFKNRRKGKRKKNKISTYYQHMLDVVRLISCVNGGVNSRQLKYLNQHLKKRKGEQVMQPQLRSRA
jgi:hypothetical protein